MEGALWCHKNHQSQLYVSMKVHSQTEKTFLAVVRIEPTKKDSRLIHRARREEALGKRSKALRTSDLSGKPYV